MPRKLPLPPLGSSTPRDLGATAPWPSPPFAPPAVARQAPQLHDLVAPYLLPSDGEEVGPFEIEVFSDGSVDEARRLRERHVAENRSHFDCVDVPSAARHAGHVSLDLHDGMEIVLGWNAEREPIQSSLTELVAWERLFLSSLHERHLTFPRRYFLQIQRLQDQHAGYPRWWITWIRVLRIA